MLSFCQTVHHIIFLVIFTWWAFLEFVQALGSSLPTLTSVSLALLTTLASASPSRNGCVSMNLG